MFVDPLADPQPGTPASSPEALVRPQSVVEAITHWLRSVHAHRAPDDAVSDDLDAHRFDHEAAFADAAARVGAGEVSSSTFDEAYRSQTPAEMLAMADSYRTILAQRPPLSPVRVHGDLTLESLLIDNGRIVGWPTVPVRFGDPYCDYAAVARAIIAVFGPGAILSVFEQLEVFDPDPIRLEFWVCISQLR